MKETQHIEWKEAWRDDHLRWVCGFANAEGGVLHVGRNDQGVVVGVADAKKLLVDLPNQVRDILGIVVPVNLHVDAGRAWLEIEVPAYPSPISYRGHYYQRVGSTNQELKGASLDRFLLRKRGKTWDGVPLPHVSVRDLSKEAFAAFRKLARQSGRLNPGDLKGPNATLLERLNLTDGGYLRRAALLLFHAQPERFVPGAFIKVGYFQTESELLYHDEIRGALFSQSARAVELLRFKYLKAAISYQGIHRIERYPVPDAALREAVLNALVHRDYAAGAPIQIRVYADRLQVWNPGELPEGWSARKLFQKHSSRPFNPAIASAFFWAGEIETWGRGIQRIVHACEAAGTPKPKITHEHNDLWLEFPFAPSYLELLRTGRTLAPGETPVKTSVKASVKTSVKILRLLADNPRMSLAEVATAVDRSLRAVELASAKLIKAGKLRHVGPANGGYWEVLS